MDNDDILRNVSDLYEAAQENPVLSYEDLDSDQQYAMDHFLNRLEDGDFRVAEPLYDSEENWGQGWQANEDVKRGVLAQFGLREIEEQQYGGVTYNDGLGIRTGENMPKATRNTPTDTTIRDGAYLGEDVTVMGPSFVNIGAYVDDGTLVDSCLTVGSAAQIGEDVKLGANTTVGGVLAPVEDNPVVIEDGASLGAGSTITSGFRLGENSVAGEQTLLSPRVPVYDFPSGEVEYGRVRPNRKAFTRHTRSSLSDRDEFDEVFQGPVIAAVGIDEDLSDELVQADELSFE